MDATMTAWVAQGGRAPGAAFTAETVPVPQLRPHDLLVEVRAVSVNPVDTKVLGRLAPGESRQLGYDAAGVVAAVGAEVTGFSAGDEVYYAGDLTRPGTNAELHAVDARIVAHKPRSLSFAEAAALPLTTITAWESLFDRLRLDADSRGALLVVGAAGGVGSMIVQLAKALTGVDVIGTASRAESRHWVKELGADQVIGHDRLADEVRRVAPEAVRWVFSPYTPSNIDAYAEVLQPFGQVVAIDDDPGSILPLAEVDQLPLGVHVHPQHVRHPDLDAQGRLPQLTAEMVDDGRLRSTLTRTIDGLNADTLAQAHELQASGSTIGKTVLIRQ